MDRRKKEKTENRQTGQKQKQKSGPKSDSLAETNETTKTDTQNTSHKKGTPQKASKTEDTYAELTIDPKASLDVAKNKKKGEATSQRTNTLGDFKLIKKLGQGGMGTVYLANQITLDRKVALKLLSKKLAKREDFVARFLREARSMAKLQHPNIVQIYAADAVEGHYYVALEFIDGQTMQDWMNQKKQLSIPDAIYTILICADALKVAHDLNMIHRDIKPDNILVSKTGVVKVADFGLAKVIDEDTSVTQSGTGLGTPLFMAPEQARNAKHVDQRTDIYALGATLYYFLTGQHPFEGENTIEVITAKEKGIFKPARKINKQISERLDLILDKMMSVKPEYRYATCEELIHDLEKLGLAGETLSLTGVANPPPGSRRVPTRTGSMTNAPATPKKQTVARTSAEDAVLNAPRKKSSSREKLWIVKYTDSSGKEQLAKWKTNQVLTAIRNDIIDIRAKARSSKSHEYLPLSQYTEFSSAMDTKVVKERAKSRAGNMKDIYAKIDRQERRRHKLKWLYNLTENAVGGFGLIVLIALVIGAGFLIYQVAPNVWSWILETLQSASSNE